MHVEVVHTHAPAPADDGWVAADMACVAAALWLIARLRAWQRARPGVRYVP